MVVQRVFAHRAILSARSGYFRKLLEKSEHDQKRDRPSFLSFTLLSVDVDHTAYSVLPSSSPSAEAKTAPAADTATSLEDDLDFSSPRGGGALIPTVELTISDKDISFETFLNILNFCYTCARAE